MITQSSKRAPGSRLQQVFFEVIAAASRRAPVFRGKANLARRVHRLRPRRPGEAWLIRRHAGHTVVVPADSSMCWQLAFTGLWDDALIEHMCGYLRPGTVGVDIGAAVGLWTVPLAYAARSTGALVAAVEPLPGNARWLNANLALNGLLSEVAVHFLALGSDTGTARIESAEMSGGSAALALDGGHPLAAEGVDIPVRRLDDLEFSAPVSFIKLDVEGFECEVLRGGPALIARDRPVIFGEFDPVFLGLRKEAIRPCLESFVERGYRILVVDVTRTRPWKARDQVRLRTLEPPFLGPIPANLLLLPNAG